MRRDPNLGSYGIERAAKPDCRMCKGTGDCGPSPDQIATGLSEKDARLLVFGYRLEKALAELAAGRGDPEQAKLLVALINAKHPPETNHP